MPISSQVLKTINFINLKGLKNVIIDFQGKQLTAIMGCNGVGKSTIIHALACIYRPPAGQDTINYRFMEFFTPTSHSIWNGSRFEVVQDFQNGQVVTSNHHTIFKKDQDRWTPRYDTRVERYVSYIGMKTAVPQIEKEARKTMIQFNNPGVAYSNAAHAAKVMQLAGRIMGRQYTGINLLTSSGKKYLGVQVDAIDYSSLSMGAGEQRIFHILDEVIKAPNNSLILIDEIDVLLHQDAFQRLLEIINELAVRKRLQIIFTTHSTSILNNNFINFRHLLQTPSKTLCFNETKPDALQRLTGIHQRPLEIFVEDFLAAAVVKKIAGQLRVSKYLSIKAFGAAVNCFSAVAGAILNQLDNFDNMLFTLDGDVYRSQDEKERALRKVLSGDNPIVEEARVIAFNKITEFILPEDVKPEQYYHSLICRLDITRLTEEQVEIVETMRLIRNVPDAHDYFSETYSRMDLDPAVGLSKLIDLLCLTPEWEQITQNIRVWLEGRVIDVQEQPVGIHVPVVN